MGVDVKVCGIPSNVKLGKLVPLFSKVLSMQSHDFFMRILPSSGPVKDIMISLPTYNDAQTAQEKLDNFVYKQKNVPYVLTAMMDDGSKSNKMSRQKSKSYENNFRQSYEDQYETGFHQDRSSTSDYGDESSRLDMQIEILKKQRMILEEERKLIEEQRKLEKLKMQPLKYHHNDDDDNVEMSEPSSNTSEPKSKARQPTFYQATGVLIRKLHVFLDKHSLPEDRKAILTHLRSVIRQRLTDVVAADGKGVFRTSKVIMLYRKVYPPAEDEEFVEKAIKDLKEGRLTVCTTTVDAPKIRENANNKPKGTESSAGDQTLERGNVSTADATSSGKDAIAERKFDPKRLSFHKASGVLLKKLNVHMDTYSKTDKRHLLVEYVRSTLKQRIAAVVDGKPIYQTHKLIKLYRLKHPISDDEDFVKELLKDIEEGRVPDEIVTKANERNVSNDKTLDEEGTEESGQLKNQISDVPGNPGNGSNIEKNGDNIAENASDNLDIKDMEKDLEEFDMENVASADNLDITNNKVDDNTQNDLVSTNTETLKSNLNDNQNEECDIKPDIAVKGEAKNGSDINADENRGIKRKNEEDDSAQKVAKINESTDIGSG